MNKLYGFDNIKKDIVDLFLNNRLHHCNLICGTKGIGKYSFVHDEVTGLVLSETNKLNRKDITNNEVENTLKLINSGGHTDFFVLNIDTLDEDGKENHSKKDEINVNQTRKIINDIKLTPSISKNKVLIIDAIDDLNINAQNALLKTLEEPPVNTYLLLICHNINKVITTIKSRSNTINVKQLSFEDWGSALFSNENVQNIEINDNEIKDLYILSNASVGFAMDILQNNALKLYDNILYLLTNKNIVEIQKFAGELTENDKFNLFATFFDRVLVDVINNKTLSFTNDFIENRKDLFKQISEKNSTTKIIEFYDYFCSMKNDINTFNLDKKHAIDVMFNKITL